MAYGLLTETSSTATLTDTLNVGTPTVTRVGTGEVCITGVTTAPVSVEATPASSFFGQPTDVIVGIVAQTASPFTCTGTNAVWVELHNNGANADGLTVHLLFVK